MNRQTSLKGLTARGNVRALEFKLMARDKEIKALKHKLSVLTVSHFNMKKTRIRQEIFKPLYTEGRATYQALMNGKGKDQEFSPEQEDKLAELATMLTDETLLIKYPTWALRAIALGITLNQINTWKHTKVFQNLLISVIRGSALHGTAAAMKTQADIAADPGRKDSTKAFQVLARLGAVEAPKVQKITQNNITIEQGIKNLINKATFGGEGEQGAEQVLPAERGLPEASDARVIEEPRGAGRKRAAGAKSKNPRAAS